MLINAFSLLRSLIKSSWLIEHSLNYQIYESLFKVIITITIHGLAIKRMNNEKKNINSLRKIKKQIISH